MSVLTVAGFPATQGRRPCRSQVVIWEGSKGFGSLERREVDRARAERAIGRKGQGEARGSHSERGESVGCGTSWLKR